MTIRVVNNLIMKNGLVNLFFAGGCKKQRGIAVKKSSDLQELKVVSLNNAGDDYGNDEWSLK